MLKRIMKAIRKRLLKIQWFKRRVELYKLKQQKKRDDQLFARLAIANYTIRNVTPLKLEPFDTLAIVTDDGVTTEYMNGRVVGEGYIDSTNWEALN